MRPSRRGVLTLFGLFASSTVTGSTMTRDEPKPVNVLLQNDDTQEWPLLVAVEDTTGSEVFQTEQTIPADTGEDLGEVLLEDAFSGNSGDQFTVRTRLDGDSAGTFDYEITCQDDNWFSLLIEHRPYDPDDGEPVDYVPDRCAD